MFVLILISLFCFSFLLSLYSLYFELRKSRKIEQVANELAKGKVVFQAPSASDQEQQNRINSFTTSFHKLHHEEIDLPIKNPEAS